MSEYLPQERRNRTVPVSILLVVIIIAGIAAYWMISAFRVTWDPVKYIPEDSVAAVIVDITGSGEKKAALASIEKALKEAGISDPGQAFIDRLDKEFGISFKKDVIQHLNGRGAAVMIPDISGATPGIAVVVGARSNKSAAAIEEVIIKGLKDNAPKITANSYKKYNYSIVPNPSFKSYIGVVDGGVVFATTEFAFKKVVDTLKGGKCLRDNADFVRLNKPTKSTVATVFFSGTQCEKMVGPLMALQGGNSPIPGMPFKPENIKDFVASVGTLDANADCLTVHIKGITKKAQPKCADMPLDKLAAVAPENAAFAMAWNGWDKVWIEIKKQLMSDKEIKTQIEQVTSQARGMLMLDPFADGLDRITMLSGYYVPGETEGFSFPGHIGITAKVDKPEVVGNAVGKIHFALAMMGGTAMTELDVAGNKAYMGPDSGGARVSDAMVGDKLVLVVSGSTPGAAVSSAVLTAKGKSKSLASSAEFKAITKHLPEKACSFLYCNLSAIYQPFSKLPGTGLEKQDLAVMKQFGRFAFTSSVSGNEYEVCGALPIGK